MKAIAFDCFGTLFDMSGVSKDEIASYVRHVKASDFSAYWFPDSWYRLKPHVDVVEGFRRIQSAGVLCVALSNGSVQLIDGVASANGFRFDHIVDLVKHRVYKPHIEAYRTVEIDLGIAPADTLMVTANPTFGDVEGASAVGMPSRVIRHGYPNTVIELAASLGIG